MLRYLMDYVRFNVLKNEEGQGLVEYGLIIVLIALAVTAGAALLGTNLDQLFTDIAGDLVAP